MSEGRGFVAHGVIERDLLGRVGHVVVATDDVTHFHVRVVHYDTEVVRGRAVCPGDDPVVQAGCREAQFPLDEVAQHNVTLLQPGLGAQRHL